MATLLVSGAINWDTTCLVEHLPIPGEEVTCDSVSEVPGGTGANAAVAAARILGPGEVALFGALGKDSITMMQIAALAAEGVLHETVVQVAGESSGHAYIFVDLAGQNVIASHLGANSALTVRHARQARLSTLLQDCRHVVLTDPPLAVAEYLLRAAADLEIPATWDPGILVRNGWSLLAPLTRKVDTLVLNEAEAHQLFAACEPRDIIRSIDVRQAPACLLLKQGARGSQLYECSTGITTTIPPLPIDALGLSVVSTVGCGDVFLGAYAAYLSTGMPRCDALVMASAAAGLNATRPETRGGPSRTELEDLVRRAGPLGFNQTDGDVP